MTEKTSAILLGLICLMAASVAKVRAQTFTVLHNFVLPAEIPYAPLIQGPDGTLYGTAYQGGDADDGTVFRVNPDGTGFTNIYHFQDSYDGANPDVPLVLSGGILYGTTSDGGDYGNGTVFMLATNGGEFSVLWEFSAGSTNASGIFTNSDGADSVAGLTLSGGTLFGTAYYGGAWGNGTIFKLSTNGGDLVPLRSLSVGNDNSSSIWTNADGADPNAGLALSGTNLYGTTYNGGTNGSGTVFRIGTNGGGFAVLKSFLAVNANTGANTSGAYPYAGVTVNGATVYGVAEGGGTFADGTVYSVSTNGTSFTPLRSFSTVAANSDGVYTNSDGIYPDGALIFSGGFLYGTTYEGGINGNGTVFKISSTTSTKFTNLYNFSTGNDGANPVAGLLLSGATLFGAASAGGNWGVGTAFSGSTNGGGITNFYIFDGVDGVAPLGGLTLSGDSLYGTASQGGASDNGMVFVMNTNGTKFTVLTNFPALDPATGGNVGGAAPQGELVLSGAALFGTATAGGANGNGAVYSIDTNGSGLTPLWSASAGETNAFGMLTNADGAYPQSGLVLADGALFGTTYQGGASGAGSVFVINANGTGFRVLTNFPAGNTNASGIWTNATGGNPIAGLILSGASLYGTTYNGGTNGYGTVFGIGTNGGGLSILKTFSATDPDRGTNSDGANPYGGLVLSGGTFYGTAEEGGTNGDGTVFALATNGSDFTVLRSFSQTDADAGTNSDGANPDGGLGLDSNMLIGTTSAGGYWAGGTVFQVNTNGSNFAVLRHLNYYTDGDEPYADLLLSGNSLWGATSAGGGFGGGSLFDLDITVVSPLLTVNWPGADLVISWPSPSAGFQLEQNSDLTTTNWMDFSGAIIDNGVIKSATLDPAGGAVYFRLYHP